jgi:hypothetical protein
MVRSAMHDISPMDNLLWLRLRTWQKEVMVVAPKDDIWIIAIQINLSSHTNQPERKNNDNFWFDLYHI